MPPLRALHLTRLAPRLARPAAPAPGVTSPLVLRTSLRSASTISADQTKQGNSPNAPQKDRHEKFAQKVDGKNSESNPAKQPDPQQEPTASTGIETEGPGGEKAANTNAADKKGGDAPAGQGGI